MKKKLFFVLMICALVAVCGVILAGCGEAKLKAPNGLTVSYDGFGWNPVEGADGYIVYFNEDETERYYLTDTFLSVDNTEIMSALKSGVKNSIYIRAVQMDAKTNQPTVMSARSRIFFDYSRKLSTPNKIKMSKDQFSWRGVSGAEDYKAYVVRADESEGTLYDMDWKVGATGNSGSIVDLPNGYLYFVSIVAVADGYENSAPSDSVPYDRTSVNVGTLTYTAYAGSAAFAMTVNPDDVNIYVTTVTAKAGDALSVKDNAGATYTVNLPKADADGDYAISLNVADGKATVTFAPSYYLYVNGEMKSKLSYNLLNNVYVANVMLADGDNFMVKDSEGKLLSTYTDGSVSQGASALKGNYVVRVVTVNADKEVDVKSGTTTDVGGSTSGGKAGMWPVTFDYNYAGAPAAEVQYAEDNRPVATPATPTRTGYVFEGWYRDAYTLIPAEFGKKQSNFIVTCPTTIYAKWSVDSGAIVEHTTHVDADKDGKCDECGATVSVQCTNHVDSNKDGKCDVCGKTMPTTQCPGHQDANGDKKCDICGVAINVVDVPVDTTAKIYLDVSKYPWFADNGAVVNVHIWYSDNTNNSFPGPAMTYNKTLGYYEADYFSSRTVKGVIFTRNNPNPNPAEGEITEWNRITVTDFVFDNEYPVYKVLALSDAGSRGKWTKIGEEEAKGDGKVYLDFRDIKWFMDAASTNMVYIWYADGTNNGQYPGVEVTYASDVACYVDYFTSKTIDGIIFTRNNPELPLGEGVWSKIELKVEDGSLTFDGAKPAYRVTTWADEAFAGYWESEADALAENTGIIEDDNETTTGIFYVNTSGVTWFEDANPLVKAYITYSDGTVNAIDGVAATVENDLYRWTYNADKTVASIRVKRINPVDKLTVWNGFEVKLSATADKNVIVLRSIEGEGDAATASYTYTSLSGGTQTETAVTVYFTDNWKWAEERGDVYAYAFEKGVERGGFPGEKMTYVGKNDQDQSIYSYTFSSSYDSVIFNAGYGTDKAVQTEDILLGEHNAYCVKEWSGDGIVSVDPWDYVASSTKALSKIDATYNGGNLTVGQDIATADVVVTATYDDASTGAVTGYTLAYDKTKAGEVTVQVNYQDKSTTFKVTYYVATETTRTIYFTDNYDWGTDNGGKINCYAFKSSDDKSVYKTWPGELMEYSHQDGVGNKAVYKYTIPVEYDTVIFSQYREGEISNQTVDVTLGADNAYYISGGVDKAHTVGTWNYIPDNQ